MKHMKKLLLILTLLTTISYSQNCSNYRLDSLITISESTLKAGTCASPDGPENQISAPPPNYAYLDANGYCNAVSPAVKDFIACYTMTAGATSVDFNAGYNTTGCTGLIINYARLYTTGSCILVDGTAIGTTTGLTIGAGYTWCISLKCTGPGPGFTSFCPYYQNITPLPIELSEFTCKSTDKFIELTFKTESQTNCDYIDVERSQNGIDWIKINTALGLGTSTTPFISILRDNYPPYGTSYYRLKIVDYNASFSYSYIVGCSFENNNSDEITYYNILGQKIDITNAVSGLYLKQIKNENFIRTEKIIIR